MDHQTSIEVEHAYPICCHANCNMPSEYDVVGSETVLFGEVVSVCKEHFKDLKILEITYEDEGPVAFEHARVDMRFYWKDEFLDNIWG